jgi:hypothetical protein
VDPDLFLRFLLAILIGLGLGILVMLFVGLVLTTL